jgi:hypothetical protein
MRAGIWLSRLLRGGGFNNNPRNLRAAYRNNNHPEDENDNIGFRCVVAGAGAQRPPGSVARLPESRGPVGSPGARTKLSRRVSRSRAARLAGEEEGPSRRE